MHHFILIFALFLGVSPGIAQEGRSAERSFKFAKRAAKKYNSGKFERSVHLYTRAIEEDPLNEFNYYYRGMANKAIGDDKAAFKDFDKGITFNTKSKNCYLERGLLHLKWQRYQKALLDFERHLEVNEKSYFPLIKKAEALMGLADYNAALIELHLAVKEEKNHSEAYVKRAHCYLELGQMEAVKSDLKNAAVLGNTSREFHIVEGRYFLKSGQPSAALESFQKLETVQGDLNANAETYRLISYAYHAKKQYGKAISNVSKSIELNPTAEYYYDRGCYAADSGDLVMALDDFTRTIELDSTFTSAYNNRTFYIWFPQEKYASAVTDLTKIIELDSSNAYAFSNRSYAYYKLDQIEYAFIDAFTSMDLEEKNPYVYKNLAFLYQKMDEEGLAKEMAEGALKLGFPMETDPEFKALLKNLGLL